MSYRRTRRQHQWPPDIWVDQSSAIMSTIDRHTIRYDACKHWYLSFDFCHPFLFSPRFLELLLFLTTGSRNRQGVHHAFSLFTTFVLSGGWILACRRVQPDSSIWSGPLYHCRPDPAIQGPHLSCHTISVWGGLFYSFSTYHTISYYTNIPVLHSVEPFRLMWSLHWVQVNRE